MRALRPGALPSDTAIRFVLLLAAVTTASLYMFQALWFSARGELFTTVALQCAESAGSLQSTAVGTMTAQLQAQAQCRSGLSREQAAFAAVGSAAILLFGWVGYRLLPSWRIRRRGLTAPDPEDGAPLVAEVAALAASAGVNPTPGLHLEVGNPAVSGFAFGTAGRAQLGVTGGLVVSQVLDPPGFAAVVRHELGHVANRDVPWTYYALSVWWAFLGLAVLPVVAIFAVRDIDYLLRLGWRTLALTGLVALTTTALLRTRELYADDRAAQWGSRAALDRLLAAQREVRATWPRALRTHPSADVRRSLLADPDGMFAASGWAALAAGIAAGTAQASLSDLLYLVTAQWAVPLAAALVAPLLAVVACTAAWRVALRERVRGISLPLVGPIGLGLGCGLAVSPLLTINAAVGGAAVGATGWAGLMTWAVGMIALSWLITRWIAASARLRVASAIVAATPPRKALIAHVTAVTLVIALWLAWSFYAHLLLTNLGPDVLRFEWVWQYLPVRALGPALGLAPLVVAALLAALPLAARLRAPTRNAAPTGNTGPTRDTGPTGNTGLAGWFWRDNQAGDPGEVAPWAFADVPRWRTPLIIGASAGVVGGLAPLGVLLSGLGLPTTVRETDHFSVLLGQSITTGHLVAAGCAAAAGALVLPRGWWPLSLISAATASAVVGTLAWVTLAAARYGFLTSGTLARRPPGWELTYGVTLEPAVLALLPAALVAALVSAGRELVDGKLGPRPGRTEVATEAPASRGGLRQTLLGGAIASLAACLLLIPTVWRTSALRLPTVATTTFEVTLPPEWQGAADPTTGQAQFVTLAQDVQVGIFPVATLSPAASSAFITVGGVTMSRIGELDQATVHFVGYEAATPAGPYRLVIAGTPAALAARQPELLRLWAAVRWLAAP